MDVQELPGAQIDRFIAHCCFLDTRVKVARSDLHEAYIRWGGHLGRQTFARLIRERGFGTGQMSAGDAAWTGLAEQAYLDHGIEVPV